MNVVLGDLKMGIALLPPDDPGSSSLPIPCQPSKVPGGDYAPVHQGQHGVSGAVGLGVTPCRPGAGTSRRCAHVCLAVEAPRALKELERGTGPRLGCGLGMWVQQRLPAGGPQRQAGLGGAGRVCPPGQLPACPASLQGAQCIGLS